MEARLQPDVPAPEDFGPHKAILDEPVLNQAVDRHFAGRCAGLRGGLLGPVLVAVAHRAFCNDRLVGHGRGELQPEPERAASASAAVRAAKRDRPHDR